MYTLTRNDAAKLIHVSTRSIDRYIKSGKIRTKKDGKIIFLHEGDVQNLGDNGVWKEQEVIIPQEKSSYTQKKNEGSTYQSQEKNLSQERNTHIALEKIYLDLKHEIKEKDKIIQDLSLRLWQAQEIAKNSVSIIEFKKSQYLLEESKGNITQEAQKLWEQKKMLEEKLRYEKTTNIVLIIFCIVLILSLWLLWFLLI